MSSSSCCFLICKQVSQEACQVVWYSHHFQNFPQLIVIHTIKGFGIVNKAEIDVFLQFSCFSSDPTDVGNWISGSSAFSKTSLNICKFTVHVLLVWLGEYWALLYQHVRWVQLCGSLSFNLIINAVYFYKIPSTSDYIPGSVLNSIIVPLAWNLKVWKPKQKIKEMHENGTSDAINLLPE